MTCIKVIKTLGPWLLVALITGWVLLLAQLELTGKTQFGEAKQMTDGEKSKLWDETESGCIEIDDILICD